LDEVHTHTPKHSACRQPVRLARFVQLPGMNQFKIGDAMPIEDRIEKYARLVLIALLFATLGWIV
jgi:hypothetical protein